MNQIIISGHITGEVVVKATKAGEKFVTFNMAWNKGTGEKAKTIFFQVSVFGNNADFVEKNFRKGSSIEVTGELDISLNEKDGKTYLNNKILANSVGFHGFSMKTENAQ